MYNPFCFLRQACLCSMLMGFWSLYAISAQHLTLVPSGWHGDTAHFVLHQGDSFCLTAPEEASTSSLHTKSDILIDASWTIDVRLRFNPSDNNYCRFFLSASEPLLQEALNGYYLMIGSRDDNVSLFRQDGTSTVRLIEGRHKLLDFSYNEVRIKVSRDVHGKWTLYTDTTMQNHYFKEGSCVDETWKNGQYLGISCNYTRTRAQHFHFSRLQVSGFPYIDSIPPRIDTLYSTSAHELRVHFNESMDTTHACAVSVNINGHGVQSYRWEDCRTLQISSAKPLLRGENTLEIQGLCDLAGNALIGNFSFITYTSLPLDVVFNEIMADPSPYVGLPEYEYLELYNRSPFELQMAAWKLLVGSREYLFPEYVFPPKSYLLITYKDADSLFQQPDLNPNTHISTIPLLTSEFALSNVGSTLHLFCPAGALVHAVTYSRSQHHPAIKEQGGWSLELVDYDNPCHASSWQSSISLQGGTPGKQNSVYQKSPDTQAPAIKKVVLSDSHMLDVFFTESIDWHAATQASYWEISSRFRDIAIDSLVLAYPHTDKLTIYLQAQPETGVSYYLKPTAQNPITDCAGNYLLIENHRFARSEKPATRDVVINEILFHPYPGEASYLELYNRSSKVINLSDLYIARKNEHLELTHAHPASDDGRLLFPGEFVAITTEKESLLRRYPHHAAENIEQVSRLISLPNAQGSVVLSDRAFIVLDEVFYDSRWHAEIIYDRQGVALEKIHHDLPSSQQSAWHSAAASVGYGTPGLENSQFNPNTQSKQSFSLAPALITPNNDGIDDYLTLNYSLDKPGYIANILVYNHSGMRKRVLHKNLLLGQEGFLLWHGCDDNGRLVETGIYLVYINLYHPEGEQQEFKLPCVVKSYP